MQHLQYTLYPSVVVKQSKQDSTEHGHFKILSTVTGFIHVNLACPL